MINTRDFFGRKLILAGSVSPYAAFDPIGQYQPRKSSGFGAEPGVQFTPPAAQPTGSGGGQGTGTGTGTGSGAGAGTGVGTGSTGNGQGSGSGTGTVGGVTAPGGNGSGSGVDWGRIFNGIYGSVSGGQGTQGGAAPPPRPNIDAPGGTDAAIRQLEQARAAETDPAVQAAIDQEIALQRAGQPDPAVTAAQQAAYDKAMGDWQTADRAWRAAHPDYNDQGTPGTGSTGGGSSGGSQSGGGGQGTPTPPFGWGHPDNPIYAPNAGGVGFGTGGWTPGSSNINWGTGIGAIGGAIGGGGSSSGPDSSYLPGDTPSGSGSGGGLKSLGGFGNIDFQHDPFGSLGGIVSAVNPGLGAIYNMGVAPALNDVFKIGQLAPNERQDYVNKLDSYFLQNALGRDPSQPLSDAEKAWFQLANYGSDLSGSNQWVDSATQPDIQKYFDQLTTQYNNQKWGDFLPGQGADAWNPAGFSQDNSLKDAFSQYSYQDANGNSFRRDLVPGIQYNGHIVSSRAHSFDPSAAAIRNPYDIFAETAARSKGDRHGQNQLAAAGARTQSKVEKQLAADNGLLFGGSFAGLQPGALSSDMLAHLQDPTYQWTANDYAGWHP